MHASPAPEPRRDTTRRDFLARTVSLGGAALLARPAPAARAGAPTTGLAFATAVEALRAIEERQVSAVELTRQALDRVDRYNPALNVYVNVLRESALARAKEADAALARGERWGPLHGLPVAIKESFGIAGVPATAGVESLANHLPAEDSEAVARLRAGGAIILGNTNVPLMLGDWQSYNAIYGTSNNPWDPSRTPGGSSGGSAAALAAGLGYLALGSDIGGSIRIPAHFCGVYGHKSTIGLVSRRGQIPPLPGTPPPPPPDLPVAGPMARSAEDLELGLRVLGGPSGDEAIAYRWTLPPPRHARLTDYRIGYVLDDPLCPMSSDVRETLEAALDAMRKAGLKLEEGWPDGVDPYRQFETYMYLLSAAFASNLEDDTIEEERARAENPEGGLGAVWARARVEPHKHFQAASGQRMAARAVWQDYFRTHDAFLMPTDFVAAFPHDHSEPNEARRIATPEGPRGYNEQLIWISFATLTGVPATTAPVGLTRDGLPAGIQILGPYLEDATPIDVARGLADVVGGFHPPAGYEA
jgi:amidase